MEMIEAKRTEYLSKLESLRQVFIGVKLLCDCTVPNDDFYFENPYFKVLNTETLKLIVGRIYIFLSDKKTKNYNTMSFKILINEILEKKNNEILNNLLSEINKVDKKYKEFRNKVFAHIELKENNSLKGFEEYRISYKEITSLLDLVQRIYNELFLSLDNASCDHMKGEIENLSEKLWGCYEQVGLVKKSD